MVGVEHVVWRQTQGIQKQEDYLDFTRVATWTGGAKFGVVEGERQQGRPRGDAMMEPEPRV